MKKSKAVELGLTIPLQRHLGVKAPPYGQEPDRRFCWDLHVIPLRGRPSLLAVHSFSRYTFVLYDLSPSDWDRLPEVFARGLADSLTDAGYPPRAAQALFGSGEFPLTRTHGRREVAFLNRAWEDVMAAELALDESRSAQPLLDRVVNAKPSRCAGTGGPDTAAERLAAVLRSLPAPCHL